MAISVKDSEITSHYASAFETELVVSPIFCLKNLTHAAITYTDTHTHTQAPANTSQTVLLAKYATGKE